MRYAVEAVRIVKKYVTKKRKGFFKSETEVVEALKGISFKIRYGEVVGLLGPNGAGKTTTIKIVSTLLLPDSGKVFVDGVEAFKNLSYVREKIGIMLTVEKGFFPKLTGRENLIYFGTLYGLERKLLEKRVNYLLDLLELKELGGSDKLYEEFSLGMKARLAFARALLKDPPIILLDEPTLGLDPVSARKIRRIVKDLAHKEGKAVLYTTHNMFEAEIVCDRILLINKGVIVSEGTPEELKNKIPKLKVIRAVLHGGNMEKLSKLISSSLNLKPEIKIVERGLEVKLAIKNPEEILNDLLKIFNLANVDVVSLNIEEPSLEDVFIYFAKGVIE